jgi:hypothetical protein
MEIEVREVVERNALSPMEVTLSGIVTEFRSSANLKVSSPMDVMLFGITMEVSPLPSNALAPMEVTLFGRITDTSSVTHLKACDPIEVKEVLADRSILSRLLNRNASTPIVSKALPPAMVMDSRSEVSKALSPIEITLFGMLIDISEPVSKADLPIDVTPGAITTAARQSLPAVTSATAPALVMVYFGDGPAVVPVEQEYSPFGGAEAWAGTAKKPVTETPKTVTVDKAALKNPCEARFNLIAFLRASRGEKFAIYGG